MRWLLLCSLVMGLKLNAQDTVRLKHLNYQTVFSKSLGYPILVEWWNTKNKVECKYPVPRSNLFSADPTMLEITNLSKYYMGSGMDRGHLSPAADNQCSGPHVADESFYFTNIAPQHPNLNRGEWKDLEIMTRNISSLHDSVFVRAGCVGTLKKIKDRLSVPTHCWKVLVVKKTNDTLAYVFPNKLETIKNRLHTHKVTLDSVKTLTGLKF